MSVENTLTIEVAYALPYKQKIITLQVPPGTTVQEAVRLSKITDEFPEIDPEQAPMGIFGQHLGTKGMAPASEYVLSAGERVEIYRPLLVDPKEVRKQRAEKARKERAAN